MEGATTKSERIETQLALWAWLTVYVVVPPLLLAALTLQARLPASDPPRQSPLPALLRWALIVQGAVIGVVGLALFIAPEAVAPIWPWQLAPLTARAIASWLIGVAVAALHAAWENDLERVRPAVISYLIFGVLQVVVLARYPGSVEWQEAGAWVYIGLVCAITLTGLAALAYGMRTRVTVE